VRLAFAVAAHLDPEILLIDEVLAVGDAEFQRKCFGKVSEVSRSGRTVFLVSHSMPSILNFCSRAILLDHGCVVASGLPQAIIERYLASIRTAGGHLSWDDPMLAPGNEIVRLVAVKITQPGQSAPTADVDIAKDTQIEIFFQNHRPDAALFAAVQLRDELGTCVLSSGNLKSISLTPDPWGGRSYPAGLYRSVCCIPANFLNEGLYRVTPIVGRGISDTQAIQEDAVAFRVFDSGEMRKEFLGGWMGVVRPRLAWSTEKLS
jgi:lipopolysaccharide transport system ATP-binding protein